ncbi:MAG: hypothetical protein Q8N77_06305 [Nanoarchaeota archaeon]|nr:hypothetical protein [Nanoarchaeota archaeon]
MKKWLVVGMILGGLFFAQGGRAEVVALQYQKERAAYTTLQVELMQCERTGDWKEGSFKQTFLLGINLGFIEHTQHRWSGQKRNIALFDRQFKLYFYVNNRTGRGDEIEVKDITFTAGQVGQTIKFELYQEQLMRFHTSRKGEVIFSVEIAVEQIFGSFGRYDVPQRCHDVEAEDSCIQPIRSVEIRIRDCSSKLMNEPSAQ